MISSSKNRQSRACAWLNTSVSMLSLAAVSLLAANALAHNAGREDDDDDHGHEGHAGDVYVHLEDGHIATGLVDEDDVEEHVRTFASELGESGVPGYSDEPGWEAFPGTFDPNIRVGWNATAALGRWNGSGFDTGIEETMTVTFGTLSFEIADAPVNGFSLAVQADGGLHRHIGFYLDNPFGAPAAGIYLVELELYSSTGSPESSEPFWIVFNNEDEDNHDAAIDWVAENMAGEEHDHHCHGDVNEDEHVDVMDLLQLISDWGECQSCESDLDSDGWVNITDLLEVLEEWGECDH
tara:strand:+ start:287 stop:1171 length:885 start_codon:yes stop_codon:yes gene_type:complete